MALEKTFNLNHMTKVRCSHILLSYAEAINSTHSRDLFFAVWEAKEIIKELKRTYIVQIKIKLSHDL